MEGWTDILYFANDAIGTVTKIFWTIALDSIILTKLIKRNIILITFSKDFEREVFID